MANRLSTSASPYLLQHADNPVDWYPWGKEALSTAAAQDKPIFLSIGYAACHWCHVMAHESFEDSQTAALLNRHFICIKVDREERPDLDALYMDAIVALTGQGGWPLSAFLTTAGEPFYGGTYFPPTPRHGLPSFRQVLEALATAWRDDRGRIHQAGAELARRIRRSEPPSHDPTPLNPALLDRGAAELFRTYDWSHGGWGAAPKFPQAMAIDFLLRKHHRSGDRLALDMVHHALGAMAAGGIFDQLGGGFHRYATDRHWRIPHFEKMLYDNALLAQAYLHAWLVTQEPLLRDICQRTVDFMLRDLRQPEGGLASSVDADSEGVEGKFYIWTEGEVRASLPETQADLFIATHGITSAGNHEGANVLHRALENHAAAQCWDMAEEAVANNVEEARAILLAQRARRPHPSVDDKVIGEWNGLALRTLAEAGRYLARPDYTRAAVELASFAADNLTVDGRVRRAWRRGHVTAQGFLADQAAFGQGLLALYQADPNPRWYQAAVGLARQILNHFADPSGGFFDTPDDGEALIARPKTLQDNASPSGNSLAVSLLLELFAWTGEDTWWRPAESALQSTVALASRHPSAFAAWMSAADTAIGPNLQLAIVGDLSDAAYARLRHVVDRRFLPRLVTALGSGDDPQAPPLLSGRKALDGSPTAYLCQGFACEMPTSSPEVLSAQIDAALRTTPS